MLATRLVSGYVALHRQVGDRVELKSSGGGTIVMGVVESISMMRTQVLHIKLLDV